MDKYCLLHVQWVTKDTFDYCETASCHEYKYKMLCLQFDVQIRKHISTQTEMIKSDLKKKKNPTNANSENIWFDLSYTCNYFLIIFVKFIKYQKWLIWLLWFKELLFSSDNESFFCEFSVCFIVVVLYTIYSIFCLYWTQKVHEYVNQLLYLLSSVLVCSLSSLICLTFLFVKDMFCISQ